MSVVDEVIIRLKAIGGTGAAADVKRADSAVGGLGKVAKMAAGVAGIGGLAIGLKDVAESAIHFQDTTAKLHNALHNVRQDTVANNERVIAAAREMATHGGLSAVENIEGIQQYIRANIGVTEALKDQRLATDISIAKGKSMSAVTRALLAVEQGRTTGLARLGIVIKPITAAQDALAASHGNVSIQAKRAAKEQDQNATKTKALTTMWQRFGGAMEAHSKTAAGAASNLKNQVDILKERLGEALLPTISKVLAALSGFVDGFMNGKGAGGEFRKVVDDVVTAVVPLGKALLDAGKQALPSVMAAIKAVLPIAKDLIHTFTDVVKALKPLAPLAGPILKMFLAWKAISLVTGMVGLFATRVAGLPMLLRSVIPSFGALGAGMGGATRAGYTGQLGHLGGDASKTVGGFTGRFAALGTLLGSPLGAAIVAAAVIELPLIVQKAQEMWQQAKDFFAGDDPTSPYSHNVPGGLPQPGGGALGGLARSLGLQSTYSSGSDTPSGPTRVGGELVTPDPAERRWLTGKAYGGLIRHSAVYNVGEHGMEKVFLPGGATVQPYTGAADTGSEPPMLENHVHVEIGARTLMRLVGYSQAKLKATS